jgi:hypothetical protein
MINKLCYDQGNLHFLRTESDWSDHHTVLFFYCYSWFFNTVFEAKEAESRTHPLTAYSEGVKGFYWHRLKVEMGEREVTLNMPDLNRILY